MIIYLLSTIITVTIGAILGSIVIIPPYEVALVERLGKYTKQLKSGFNTRIPLIERVKRVDLREKVLDVEPQEVICKDNVVVVVDAIIYYKIIDPVKVEYKVNNFIRAISKIAQTSLRSIIGEMELDETLSGRDTINLKLRDVLDKITDSWGIKITRVEIQRIEPPKEIEEAMAKQMKAEREKRSMILLAEGQKKKEILTAEGTKSAKILQAEGEAKAKLLRAEAEAKAVKMVMDVANNSNEKYLSLKYIEQLPNIAKSSNTLVLPYEITSFLGGTSTFGEFLNFKNTKKTLKANLKRQPNVKKKSINKW